MPTTGIHEPSSTLASIYVVSGLPKSPHTWMLADQESTTGLAHTQGAVGRFWRSEVLGSTVSPGIGSSPPPATTGRKKASKDKKAAPGVGAPTKQETAKLLSKALKFSFPTEIEIIASTLQPVSTVHNFSFTLPVTSASHTDLPSTIGPSSSSSPNHNRFSAATYNDIPRPSSAYLGPPPTEQQSIEANRTTQVTYHGVCLTVWSHADEERSAAIRRALEQRTRKASQQTLPNAPAPASRRVSHKPSNASQSSLDAMSGSRIRKPSSRHTGPWSGTEAETDAETDGGMASESEYEFGGSTNNERSVVGESTLFLPQDTVFWLPYALTLVSKHPIYDLMRDYLTLSWARFSKDVQAHTLQIAKILAHPAPRGGDVVRLDASAAPAATKTHRRTDSSQSQTESSLEVVCRFPGGMDFGRGLVDANHTMWPLFKALDLDNILTICEVAMAPTGRVMFLSRYPAMLGVAVLTVKYLLELRGWSGIACPVVHCRDARIYVDDPGPWLIGLPTEARHTVQAAREVCVVDLDINHVTCVSPPLGYVSTKAQRDKYRRVIQSAFDAYWHPDCSIPSEFKEAFPAGRFRPLTKIQSKRAGISSVAAESVTPPEWWNGPKVIQAFNQVLIEKSKKPNLFRRLTKVGRRQLALTTAEQLIQLSIRKRATAFVDSRDEMESKIGRLARRLNFLMTESDLWREKFVTFEKYAEKLSVESSDLRQKINKEQRESRRLSGLVSVTAQEKVKLQEKLIDTESAHRDATVELNRMRREIERMENERAEMIAEVEVQIERALASMSVADIGDIDLDLDEDDEDLSKSQPGSRRPSFRATPAAPMLGDVRATAIQEEEEPELKKEDQTRKSSMEEDDSSGSSMSRFDGTTALADGNLSAVDLGITEKSERITRKVEAIQKKLETALAKEQNTHSSSYSEESDGAAPKRRTSPITTPRSHLRPPRANAPHNLSIPIGTSGRKVTKAESGSSLGTVPSVSPSTPSGTTDDGGSDTDWKSAYSSHSGQPSGNEVDVHVYDSGEPDTPPLSDFGGAKAGRIRTESISSQQTASAHDTDGTAKEFTTRPARLSMSAVGA
ncbi:AEX-3 domain-containing protein [Auriculariales sp. MPI-PUGE-AT-0066]|nr:AEX-3 domain-containing protein [Auriculariales sp. MPI-PUGE-AT-0066]